MLQSQNYQIVKDQCQDFQERAASRQAAVLSASLPHYTLYRLFVKPSCTLIRNYLEVFPIVVSRCQQRTYGPRGRPRRPNPLRGKDLGQQHNTTLDCQVQIELFLGNPLDVARLTSVEDFLPFHDLGPLMPLAVWSVEDNANDTSRFSLKIFHN